MTTKTYVDNPDDLCQCRECGRMHRRLGTPPWISFEKNEKDHAIKLANHILDRLSGDPDDDLAVLARQFLRALEGTP
jgi:hypothetical protein